MESPPCAGARRPLAKRCVYAVAMREIAHISVFEDKAFLTRMTRTSFAVLGAGALLGILWFALGAPGRLGLSGSELASVLLGDHGPRFAWLASLAIGCFVSFGVHELVHAAFFKLFAPPGSRVTFGANWKAGMLYACAEGVVYTRRRYLTIVLAPSVVLTALLLVAAALGSWPVLCYALAVLHLSGCTGDWGYAATIMSDRRIAYCEDTDWGVRFFGEGDDSGREEPDFAEVLPAGGAPAAVCSSKTLKREDK